MKKEELKQNLQKVLYIALGIGIGVGVTTYIYKTKKIPLISKKLLEKIKEIEILRERLNDANHILFLSAGEDVDLYRLQKEVYSELEIDFDVLDEECMYLTRSYRKLK